MGFTDVHEVYEVFQKSNGVFTDTRAAISGGLFIALKGPNFNGNEYASEALERGAFACVVDDERYAVNEKYILVEDGLLMLQALGRKHRDNFNQPVIALTGSNGKTSTKELIASVLGTTYKVISTSGNLNNHIGVPLTLLRITSDCELAVIEMGANHVGEIAALCEIANPTHGMITNIGKAHIEGFGSVEGIKKGKGELYRHLKKNKGTVFLNSQDSVLTSMSSDLTDVVKYPALNDFCQIELIESEPYVVFKTESGGETKTHLPGKYNYHNLAAAICIGKYFKVPMERAELAVASYVPEMNRSQIITKGTNTIILDAYNANPDSMKAAIENLEKRREPNKVAILGDMLELGPLEIEEHQELGRLVKKMKPARALFCGNLVRHSAGEVAGSLFFPSKSALLDYLHKHPIENSTILVKASRGIALEDVIETL